MSAPENPPAFPVSEVRTPDGIGISEGSPGMTLRDHFASQALTGYISKNVPLSVVSELDAYYRAVARSAYAVADAMLAERAK